ncbi:MAG: type 4a pilus biogenesis protein PilO [Calditrichaeota bacterium]|nr:type 4a pilus biogenesis protein PilO [Calditrichota bacterium]
MLTRNLFFGLLLIVAVLIGSFYLLIYTPKQNNIDRLKQELNQTVNKFNSAKRAENDLENIRGSLTVEQNNLEKLSTRFIKKNNLSDITMKIRKNTRESNLELIDFTPIFKEYFSDTSTADIKALPFSITVKGRYLEIGRFIDGWENLDFFMIPDEIYLNRMSSSSNLLEANITGHLYAWANIQE